MPPPQQNRFQPKVEQLEDRRLMASSLTANLSGTTLRIEGTEAADKITVRQIAGNLSVDGIQITSGASKTNSLAASKVAAVLVYGLGGNDTIHLDKTGSQETLLKPATIYGGTGDDLIYSSDGNDNIFADAGNDTVWSGGGNDQLRGADGNDKLYGQGGVDSVYGENGDDYLNGGTSLDNLSGGGGNDTFRRNMAFSNNPYAEDRLLDGPNVTTPASDSMFHIDQAASNTCVILAALAAAADWTGRFPGLGSVNNDLLKNIVYDGSKDLYGVRLFVGGAWKTIYVNSDWNQYYEPQGQLWVSLYQKAYLKAMDVVYQRPDGSFLPEGEWRSTTGKLWQNGTVAMEAITGQKPTYVDNGTLDAATMRTRLRAGLKLVGLSKYYVSSDLVGSHAYAILDVFQEGNVWKVKMYNPWAHDRRGSSLDGNDEGIVTITFTTFKTNFFGYAFN